MHSTDFKLRSSTESHVPQEAFKGRYDGLAATRGGQGGVGRDRQGQREREAEGEGETQTEKERGADMDSLNLQVLWSK